MRYMVQINELKVEVGRFCYAGQSQTSRLPISSLETKLSNWRLIVVSEYVYFPKCLSIP